MGFGEGEAGCQTCSEVGGADVDVSSVGVLRGKVFLDPGVAEEDIVEGGWPVEGCRGVGTFILVWESVMVEAGPSVVDDCCWEGSEPGGEETGRFIMRGPWLLGKRGDPYHQGV